MEKSDLNLLLEKAILLAVQAHSGQRDKSNRPYILHPLKLMLEFEDLYEQMVAVLHDVIEDTDLTRDKLIEAGFDEVVVEAVDCLSKRDGEDYFDFIDRVKGNPLARKIKIADIRHNLDLGRLSEITDADRTRAEKYQAALTRLLSG